MKNLVKMLNNSSYVYKDRSMLKVTFANLKGISYRCNELINLINDKYEQYDISNAFDNLFIVEDSLSKIIENYTLDVEKQFNGVTEEGFLEKNLLNIKNNSSTKETYVASLQNCIKDVNNMINFLRTCKKDLLTAKELTPNLVEGFSDVLSKTEKSKSEVSSITNNYLLKMDAKIVAQKQTLSNIDKTTSKIDELINIYIFIVDEIRKEINKTNESIKTDDGLNKD